MDLLENVLESRPDNAELKKTFEEYCAKYEEDILKKAEAVTIPY